MKPGVRVVATRSPPDNAETKLVFERCVGRTFQLWT